MLRELDIQGYHDKTDGPDRLVLWVEVALKAATQLQKVREAEQLKAKLMVKQQFLSDASHEMRTPLHLILGYSELLLDGGVTPLADGGARAAVAAIQRQARSLGAQVHNFLNY